MKKTLIILLVIVLSGCATLSYKAPDGTEVSYTRFATNSDNITGQIGDATINSQGQKVDTKIIDALTNLVNAARGL